MGNGYSRSPKLLKGAIVQFVEMPIIPIPNIIVFQYNPESLSRTLSPYAPPEPSTPAAGGDAAAGTPPGTTPTGARDQPFDPTERFTLNLVLDASDALEVPEAHPVAFVTGVADRIAALEMLIYPATDRVLNRLLRPAAASVGGPVAAGVATAPIRPQVPVTLFVWGPGRIVPVRLDSFSVEEQQWNQLLYPVRAKVAIGMKVVTRDSFRREPPATNTTAEEIAMFCYDFTRGQKEVLALANVANTVESILGILPF